MDINLDDLKYVIHSCFILNNFHEINKKPFNSQYDMLHLNMIPKFQSPTQDGYKINNNEGNGKRMRRIYVKHFT